VFDEFSFGLLIESRARFIDFRVEPEFAHWTPPNGFLAVSGFEWLAELRGGHLRPNVARPASPIYPFPVALLKVCQLTHFIPRVYGFVYTPLGLSIKNPWVKHIPSSWRMGWDSNPR
jgi:hypothetical protein